MNAVVSAFGALVLLFLIGHALTRLVIRADEAAVTGIERLSLAWFLGIAFVSFAQLYMLLFHIPLTRWTILAACAVPASAGFYGLERTGNRMRARTLAADWARRLAGLSPSEKCACAALACLAVMNLYVCVSIPVSTWDAMAAWAYKAKVLFYTKTIYTEDFLDPYSFSRPVAWPYFLSLAMHYMYEMMGTLNEQLMKPLFSVMFGAGLLFFYSALRRSFGLTRAQALLGALAFFSIPAFFIRANGGMASEMADVPLGLYYAVSFVYLSEFVRRRCGAHFKISIAASAAVLVLKNEGVVLYAFMLAYLFSEEWKNGPRSAYKRVAAHAFFTLLIASSWFFLRRVFPPVFYHFGLETFFSPEGFSGAARNAPLVAVLSLKQMFVELNNFGLLWYALLAAVFLPQPSGIDGFTRRRERALLAMALLYFLMLAINEAVPLGRPVSHEITFGFARFRFHLMPLLWMCAWARLCRCAAGESSHGLSHQHS